VTTASQWKRLEDGRVDVSHTGARTGPGRQVLNHRNPGGGKEADIAPPVGSVQIGKAGHGRIGRPHPASRGIAQHSRKAPVTHCNPGCVNPWFRSRTANRSMALAMVQVSNWRKASSLSVVSTGIVKTRFYVRAAGGENTRCGVFCAEGQGMQMK